MPWPMRIGFFWDGGGDEVCVGGRVRMSPGMTNVSMSCSLTCICVSFFGSFFFFLWIDFCFKFFVEENSRCCRKSRRRNSFCGVKVL